MAVRFEAFPRENYLYIKSNGECENLDKHKEYNLEVCNTILQYKFNRILVDEQDVTYPDSILDLYDLAHFYDREFPVEARLFRLALVGRQKYRKEASFWELVCQNLGFQFRVFGSIDEAESWLLEQK